MKNHVAAAALAVLSLGNVSAAPILLNSAGFAAAIAPLTPVVENFEGFAPGPKTSPVVLANSTFSSNAAFIYNGSISPTHNIGNNSPDGASGRVFGTFGAGTVLFGLDVGALNPADILNVTVTAVDGTLSLHQTIGSFGGFIGFQDAQGLISVTFQNVGNATSGIANYVFDNVTTAASDVPEPSSLALLGVALAGFLTYRRKA